MNRRALISGALAAAPLSLLPATTEAVPDEGRWLAPNQVVFDMTLLIVHKNTLHVGWGQVIVPAAKIEFIKYTLSSYYPDYGVTDGPTSFAHMPHSGKERLGDVYKELSDWLASVKRREFSGEILLYWSGTVDE